MTGRRSGGSQLDLVDELRLAVERQDFLLEYQPIMDLGNGAVVGTEALVRWRHPARGTVPPGEFLSIAEETGDIIEIGRWVLARSCRQARAWQLGSPHHQTLVMSVNLSRRQLLEPRIVADVEAAFRDASLAPESLVLEIAGRSVPRDEGTLGTLAALRALGVRLALDDFGTASTLADARELPVDVVKLDARFVAEAAGPQTESVFAEALLDIARTRRLETIAKGVERREVARALKSQGCDLAQGYLYSKPLGPEGIGALLARARFGPTTRRV